MLRVATRPPNFATGLLWGGVACRKPDFPQLIFNNLERNTSLNGHLAVVGVDLENLVQVKHVEDDRGFLPIFQTAFCCSHAASGDDIDRIVVA